MILCHLGIHIFSEVERRHDREFPHINLVKEVCRHCGKKRMLTTITLTPAKTDKELWERFYRGVLWE